MTVPIEVMMRAAKFKDFDEVRDFIRDVGPDIKKASDIVIIRYVVAMSIVDTIITNGDTAL